MLYVTDMVPAVTPWGRNVLHPRGYQPGAGQKWAILGDTVLMHSPIEIASPRIAKFADDHREKATGVARSELLKLTNDGRQIRTTDDISEVLFRMARTPVGGKYAALMPSKARQRYEFRLGPILVTEDVFVPPSTTSFADNFNRSADLDGSTASGGFTWTKITGGTNSTNGTHLVFDDTGDYYTSSQVDSDNNYAQGVVGSVTGNSYAWIYTSYNSAGTNGYEAGFGVGNAFEMYGLLGGTFPLLDSDTWAPVAATVEIRRDGSSISATETATNVTLTATNSAEGTGSGNRRGGIGGFSNAGSATFDSCLYADIVVGGGDPVRGLARGKLIRGGMLSQGLR